MIRIFKQYYLIQSVILFIGESLIILTGLLFASPHFTWPAFFRALLITAICQLVFYYNDFYKIDYGASPLRLSLKLIQCLGITLMVLAVIGYFMPLIVIGDGTLFFNICIIGIFIYSWRLLVNFFFDKNKLTQRILIVGTGNLAKSVAREVLNRKNTGVEILGFVSNDAKDVGKSIFNPEVLGTYEDLDKIIKGNSVRVVVALDDRRGNFPLRELLDCKMQGVIIEDHISFLEKLRGQLMIESLNPSHIIFSDGFKKSKTTLFVKRMEDIFLSIIALIVLSPFLILTAILIKLDSKGPLFFKQERVGENGKVFTMYKFRSMKVDAEKDRPLWAKENDDRVTRVGRYIRRFGIDEAPQLWNVLKGDMSLVGPRPERPCFVKELTKIVPYYNERHSVKPGITGWAQIKYRYGASVEDAIEKLKYELYYIKHLSPIFDLLILFETVKKIIFGKISR